MNATNHRHLFANWQGSISAITDATGNVVQVNAYDAHGIPNATNLGRFQYTRACAVSGGHGGTRSQILVPEIGIYHYKARAYSPYLGRFLQTDPIGYEDQYNLYAYVGNDPMNARDPTGMDTACGPTGENCSDPGYGEIVVVGPELTDSSQNDVGILISRNFTGPEVREDEMPQNDDGEDESFFDKDTLEQACIVAAGLGYDNAVAAGLGAAGGGAGYAAGAAVDTALERRGALSGSRSFSDMWRSALRNGWRGARTTGRFARFGGLGGLAAGVLVGAVGGIAVGEFAERQCGGLTE